MHVTFIDVCVCVCTIYECIHTHIHILIRMCVCGYVYATGMCIISVYAYLCGYLYVY